MSPQEARRLVGHDLSPMPMTEPQPCPTRVSRIVARSVLAVVVFGACLGFCAASKAAEVPPPRVFILWNESTDTAWLSPKGNTATSTTATACVMATVEAARHSPAGTRLACRRVR